MLDYVIRNGTGRRRHRRPGTRADVGIRDGVIVAVGPVDEAGTTELDAEGLVVAPGHHRPPHPLRRPAVLGPDRLPVQPARGDHGDRRATAASPWPRSRQRTTTTSAG